MARHQETLLANSNGGGEGILFLSYLKFLVPFHPACLNTNCLTLNTFSESHSPIPSLHIKLLTPMFKDQKQFKASIVMAALYIMFTHHWNRLTHPRNMPTHKGNRLGEIRMMTHTTLQGHIAQHDCAHLLVKHIQS